MELARFLRSRLSLSILLYWALLLSLAWLFAELLEEVYAQGGFFFDEPVLAWFYERLNPLTTKFMLVASTIGGTAFMIALSVAVTLLLWRLARREARFFAFSMLGASLIMLLTKLSLNRPRPDLYPDVDLWQTASASFPSGHATGSAAFFLSLYFVLAHKNMRWRLLAAVLGLLMVIWISTSRLYLQVHYPSDILAGLALGTTWVLGVNALYRWRGRDKTKRTVLLTLPTHLIKRYEEEAAAKNLSEDEIMTSMLEKRYKNPQR